MITSHKLKALAAEHFLMAYVSLTPRCLKSSLSFIYFDTRAIFKFNEKKKENEI